MRGWVVGNNKHHSLACQYFACQRGSRRSTAWAAILEKTDDFASSNIAVHLVALDGAVLDHGL
jgi:hypothetical protein